MFTPRLTALAVASIFAVGAAHATPAPARAENPFLSQADAAARSARVSNVDYVLDFTLTGKPTFSATDTLTFDLADTDAPLTIDLDKASIKSLTVNGKQVQPHYNQWFITIDAKDLVKGHNTVTVAYDRPHSTNGEGLHRMVDPVDGRIYTYSHFEPAAAHQMFAVFDQPDLKATYTLTVTVPSDWVVVSAKRESKVEDLGAMKRWTFPQTKKLSPYNFSMHAGPYKVWEDDSGKYPMRLFARQSVASQIKPAEWFKYTKAGLAFFDKYYGIPYQFEKYDQILVPDFLYGAMENSAAVTFAEHGFMYKADMTAAQRETLAMVIMHEMAHQWFGDMVTMKWWDGLWLNESFAEFMGYLGTAEATEFKDAWQSFYSNRKLGAYAQDQQSTTHPIEVPVPSTRNAFDNIDAITYSKGAAVLTQLRHLLGEDVFRKGVHAYLTKYAYKNATLDDFIGTLGQTAGRDLSHWTQEWLYQPGVDTITANYSCKGGKIASFALDQSAPSAQLPTLREQRVQVATFKLDGKQLKLAQNLPVTYSDAHTEVAGLVGSACPDLVYPNYQDWGFAKVALDQRSFATTRAHLSGVAEPMLRTMLWQGMWDSVRDGKLPLNEFIKTALVNAPAEKDYTLLGDVLHKIGSAHAYLLTMGDTAYARKTTQELEAMAWHGVQASRGNDDFQRRWFSSYIAFTGSHKGLERLASILAGKTRVDGLEINQDLRWSIIEHLNRFGYPGSAALVDAELARDKSDTGQAAAVAARASRPDAKSKAEWLGTIEDLQTKLPFSKVRVAMHSLYPAEQHALAEQTADARLARLPELDKTAGPVYMRSFVVTLIPASCTPASVKRLTAAVDSMKDLSAGTRRALVNTQQEDQRCVAIRQAMTAPQS